MLAGSYCGCAIYGRRWLCNPLGSADQHQTAALAVLRCLKAPPDTMSRCCAEPIPAQSAVAARAANRPPPSGSSAGTTLAFWIDVEDVFVHFMLKDIPARAGRAAEFRAWNSGLRGGRRRYSTGAAGPHRAAGSARTGSYLGCWCRSIIRRSHGPACARVSTRLCGVAAVVWLLATSASMLRRRGHLIVSGILTGRGERKDLGDVAPKLLTKLAAGFYLEI